MDDEKSRLDAGGDDMAAPADQRKTYPRSGLQKACMFLCLGLIVLAMAATAAITFMELPPVNWINRAQDAVINGHFGMIAFVIVMIPMVALAMGITFVVVRVVRGYMAARNIPWVDDDGHVIE
ncbi:MAG: hypothetical protein ISS69_09155 [Phycisphaerae bacterium]|nr:hypothetical protein [Planctomycetota bacterium]MBL7220268.1 hypothetical protein [Phycisphaerae bacterium]